MARASSSASGRAARAARTRSWLAAAISWRKAPVRGSDPAPRPSGRLPPSRLVPDDFVLGPSWASALRARRFAPSKLVPDDFVLGPSWASALRARRFAPSKLVPDDFVMQSP